ITQCLFEIDTAVPSGVTTPTPFHKCINVQQDGKPEGVEITIPQFAFTMQRLITLPLSSGYVNALYRLTGCVNADTMIVNAIGTLMTFQIGELLFLGATGTL